MGRRGYGMVSARSDIYRLQSDVNAERDRVNRWFITAQRLADLVLRRKYKEARSLAESTRESKWPYRPPEVGEIPYDWRSNDIWFTGEDTLGKKLSEVVPAVRKAFDRAGRENHED